MTDPLFVEAALFGLLYLVAAIVVVGILILVLEDVPVQTLVRTWWRR